MSPETRLEVGRILCGKWRIDAKLGEGGMATVWSGTHRNGMRVAIKALRAELGGNVDTRDRFLREGYVANHIDHPGVVTILDDDVTEDGVVFLVMELLEGMSLKEMWTERNRQLPPSEVVMVARAVLDVLAAAHDKGVVHRDLKPDNLFLLSSGGVRILDFGIARLREIDTVDQRTRTGNMLGTPAFMPPEQALGHWDEVDLRSDIFALGATMWTLLTGALVHRARTVQELLVLAATKQAPPIGSVIAGLDPRLARVIDRALAFDRRDRWPSARDMLDALEPLTRADPVTDVLPQRPDAPESGVGAHGSWNSIGAPPLTRVLDTPTHFLPGATLDASPAVDTASPTIQPLAATGPRRARWAKAAIVACVVMAAGAASLFMKPAARKSLTPLTASAWSPSAAPPAAPASSSTATPTATASLAAPPSSRLPMVRPSPRLPAPPPPPSLDCAGKDFSNPACARR